MKGARAIATRELASYFRQPAGWIIIALYLLVAGLTFGLYILEPGSPASLRYFFALSGWLLLPVAPAISMRLISDELRLGTIEGLLASPITGKALVIGKFMGAAMFMLAMLLPTGIYAIILFRVAEPAPDLGPLVAGYLCLVLMGLMYLAIGTLASSLTSNSTLAFMMTLFVIMGLLFIPLTIDKAPEFMQPVLSSLSLSARVADFARGVVDTGHVIFFASGAAWFLLLAVASVELKRWR